ncbi:unnamed protein product, partial [Sphagnum compactum]
SPPPPPPPPPSIQKLHKQSQLSEVGKLRCQECCKSYVPNKQRNEDANETCRLHTHPDTHHHHHHHHHRQQSHHQLPSQGVLIQLACTIFPQGNQSESSLCIMQSPPPPPPPPSSIQKLHKQSQLAPPLRPPRPAPPPPLPFVCCWPFPSPTPSPPPPPPTPK